MLDYKYTKDNFSVFPIFNDQNICVTSNNDDKTMASILDVKDNGRCSNDLIVQPTPIVGSSFDMNLQLLWNDANKKQLFRYSFKEMPSRVISEKYQFFLQLNPERASKRRKPQEIQYLNQPFNPEEFNFNKTRQEETIMTLTSLDKQTDLLETKLKIDSQTIEQYDEPHSSILINVSPLEYCHVLLVPFPSQNQPQAITMKGLKTALEVLFLSHSCDFRVGFNSLCGFASVNHHHYHAYYLKHRLYIEYAELKLLAGPCWEFKDNNYPAPGFIFILNDLKDLDQFVKSCFLLISHMQENNIAHNMYITRGSTLNIKSHFDCVRVIIWGRTSSYGAKDCEAFNPALCELAGHFPIKNEVSYTTLTEELIFNELKEICQTTFSTLKNQIGLLWKDNVKEIDNQAK